MILENYNTDSARVSTALPERILQFGHGDIFRKLSGFTDDFISEDEIKNSSIVVVTLRHQSTGSSSKDILVSRILCEKEQWPDILGVATDPQFRMILFDKKLEKKNILKDNINLAPPFSLPGKLLALLYNRFKKFGNDPAKGVAIISVNGDPTSSEIVQSVLLEVAHLNDLSPFFLDWIENANRFYSIYK